MHDMRRLRERLAATTVTAATLLGCGAGSTTAEVPDTIPTIVMKQNFTTKAELEKLVPITRAEAGCLQYDLHQDNDNQAHFLFYENWEARDLWQAHMNAPHLKDYMAATEGAVAEFTLNEMSQIA